MKHARTLLVVGIAGALAACATVPPSGPSVMVLPGSQSNFNQFQVDNYACQDFARQASGAGATAAQNSAVNSAAAGTLVGAAAGALIGAAAGDPATGAAVGAGTGLAVGSAGGAGVYQVSAYELQDRYDTAYVQCMYAKGHQVPVPAGMTTMPNAPAGAPPPPAPPAPLPPPPHPSR